MDYESAREVAEDPWQAKLRNLPEAARVLLHSSRTVIARAGRSAEPGLERDYATMLLTVLQARAFRRATWALVWATIALVLVTGAHIFAQVN